MDQELFAILKQKIEEMPFNSLKRVYPEDFAKWFDSSHKNIEDFITEMIRTNLLLCKYDFICDCMNNCTAYDRVIYKNGIYYCEDCGREYSYDYISKKGELLYEINKSDVLEYNNRALNFRKLIDNNKVIGFDKERREEDMPKKDTIYNNTTNNITIYGNVSESSILQGNKESQQINNNTIPDYDYIIDNLQKIVDSTSDDVFEKEFGEDAEQVKQLLKDALNEANKRNEPSKLKDNLQKVMFLISKTAVNSVVGIGVKSIVEEIIKNLSDL